MKKITKEIEINNIKLMVMNKIKLIRNNNFENNKFDDLV